MKTFCLSVVLFFLFSNCFSQTYNVIFSENFDATDFGNKWTKISSNASYSWQINELDAHSFDAINPQNVSSAICPWDYRTQDEWLISPQIQTTDTSNLSLVFYAGFNKSYLTKNATLQLYVSQSNWQTADSVWDARSVNTGLSGWKWQQIVVDLKKYAGTKFSFAWRYVGATGDLIAIDDIDLATGYQYTLTQIDSFKLDAQTSPAIINKESHTIKIEVAYGTNLNALSPQIVISDGATISPPPGQAITVSNRVPFEFVVTAKDTRFSQKWYLTVGVQDYKTDILSFAVPVQLGVSVIDTTNHIVNLVVRYGTDLKKLVPEIVVSPGASISPQSGQIVPFTEGEPVQFTVTPANPKIAKQVWRVFVKLQEVKTGTEILTFKVANQFGSTIINKEAKTIKVEVRYDADLTQIAPEITISDDASISPKQGANLNFEQEVEYTVTASNPNIKPAIWKVRITKRNYESAIKAFSLPQQEGRTILDTTNHIITIAVNNDMPLTNIKPAIVITEGASIQPDTLTPVTFTIGQNFMYTVTAANSLNSTQWKIIVINAILIDDFDDAISPFAQWDIAKTNTKTWTASNHPNYSFTAFDKKNRNSALCPWDLGLQNELLVSKKKSTAGFTNFILTFYALFDKNYLNNATLRLFLRSNNIETEVWNVANEVVLENGLAWHLIELPLHSTSDSIQLVWQYAGSNGNLCGIDNILLVGAPAASIETEQDKDFPVAYTQDNYLFVNQANEAIITLRDYTGRLLLQLQSNSDLATIDIASYHTNVFLITISKKNLTFTTKIVTIK